MEFVITNVNFNIIIEIKWNIIHVKINKLTKINIQLLNAEN